VANIFEANDSDLAKAEETIYFDVKHPTRVELPVMRSGIFRFGIWVRRSMEKQFLN
jgi:hypothetical protein